MVFDFILNIVWTLLWQLSKKEGGLMFGILSRNVVLEDNLETIYLKT